MKIVIEISDNEYKQICELRLHNRTFYDDAIRNGTPLPKGHWVTRYNEVFKYYCDNCGTGSDLRTNYCSNCGADMGGNNE